MLRWKYLWNQRQTNWPLYWLDYTNCTNFILLEWIVGYTGAPRTEEVINHHTSHSFWTVCGFFYVPHQYCETGHTVLSSNHLQMLSQKQHFLLRYLKSLRLRFEPVTSCTAVWCSTNLHLPASSSPILIIGIILPVYGVFQNSQSNLEMVNQFCKNTES